MEGILARQECVQELCENETLVFDLEQVFDASFLDFETVLKTFVKANTDQGDPKTAEANITALIKLKHVLQRIEELGGCLQQAGEQPILQGICNLCSHGSVVDLKNLIDEVFSDHVKFDKKPAGMEQMQVYAIREGKEPVLDMAREMYAATINKIYDYCDKMKEHYDLHSLKIACDKTSGYHFVLKRSEENKLGADPC
eukprot:TRINITY_DN4163_c0_g1_i12.p1 TRINITY_DN4163_c0_g1~~TRINITY_DN4163_c0_g1_i12.p1  ORF type:complete len:198 (+),score=44.88 TRINITY_DN4163_c0_g1_i12:1161-1754(+)